MKYFSNENKNTTNSFTKICIDKRNNDLKKKEINYLLIISRGT